MVNAQYNDPGWTIGRIGKDCLICGFIFGCAVIAGTMVTGRWLFRKMFWLEG